MRSITFISVFLALSVSISAQLDSLSIVDLRQVVNKALSEAELNNSCVYDDIHGVLFRLDCRGRLVDFELKSKKSKCRLMRKEYKKLFNVFDFYNYTICINETHRPYEIKDKNILKIYMPLLRQ